MKKIQDHFIPDLILERYLLGEMSKAEIRKLDHLLTQNKDAQRRLEELRRSNREIAARYPAAEAVPEVNRRLWADTISISKPVFLKRPGLWLRFAPAAALVVVLIGMTLMINPWNNVNLGSLPEITRLKGIFTHPQLIIYRERGHNPEKLHNGSMVKPGERLQFGYNAAGKSDGVIFSIDGRGLVTLHYPERVDDSTVLKFNKAIFSYSYELDDAPYFERFFLITANERINVSQVLNAAWKLARDPAKAFTQHLDLPVKLVQTSFFIKKEDLQ